MTLGCVSSARLLRRTKGEAGGGPAAAAAAMALLRLEGEVDGELLARDSGLLAAMGTGTAAAAAANAPCDAAAAEAMAALPLPADWVRSGDWEGWKKAEERAAAACTSTVLKLAADSRNGVSSAHSDCWLASSPSELRPLPLAAGRCSGGRPRSCVGSSVADASGSGATGSAAYSTAQGERERSSCS